MKKIALIIFLMIMNTTPAWAQSDHVVIHNQTDKQIEIYQYRADRFCRGRKP